MASEPSTQTAGGIDPAASNRENPNGNAAVRIFRHGTSIGYACEIFNARADGNDKSQLEMQIRLFRDGQQVYNSPPTLLNPQGDPKAKRLASGVHMQLTNVPPGNYVMQVVVYDTLRKDK